MAYCYDDYIAHAEEAESMAQKANNEPAKATWLRIATGFRELAMMTQNKHSERDRHGLRS